eukprot:TRINITY_DN12329_c0_g1_i1.p2 TRINITY_DN12329_c0_g1~~TRINITY_DN12329_c0_g1_i1.p2  ORF type:complete len:380 (+),score=81.91 TRINITY_DN12329_c0_g1_i1:1849-2988(+)
MLSSLTMLEMAAAGGCVVWLAVVALRFLTPHTSVAYNKSNKKLARVVESCTPIHDYSPLPFHFVDFFGFFATTVPFYLRRTTYDPIYKREAVALADGGTVSMDWGQLNVTTDRTAPVVLIQHGLAGSSKSFYVVHLVKECLLNGMRPVVMNARGCGETVLSTPESFHAARTSDFDSCLAVIRTRYPDAKVFAVGFSLGAAILANYLGRQGSKADLDAAVLVSPPWNFHLKTPTFHIWDRNHLIKGLFEYARANEAVLRKNKDIDFDDIFTAKTVREFDSKAIVPQFGFQDVDDYYTQASPLQYAHRITVPTLAINAVDDPVCAHDGCPEGDQIGEGLVMVRTRIGGHVAFAENLALETGSWMERAAISWFERCAEHMSS